MKTSLHLRLLLAASLVLLAFMGVVGFSLERAFQDTARETLKRQLTADTLYLLAVSDFDESGNLRISSLLPDTRFSVIGSGLYGFVFDAEGNALWQSPSTLGIEIIPMLGLESGESAFVPVQLKNRQYNVYYQAFTWGLDGSDRPLLFAVAENGEALASQIGEFRRTLWGWLSGAMILLVLLQLGVLRWSLLPLRQIVGDLEAIESGSKGRLSERYPQELQRLAASLNALLRSERAHLERYRNSLADLAHSLKTPLAILNGYVDSPALDAEARQTMLEQLDRMDQIVEYQLQRAAARGHKTLSSAVDVAPLIQKILASLDKVHAGKGVTATLHCQKPEKYLCEEGDLYEIAGNLIDNAYKWCRTRVDVAVHFTVEEGKRRPSLRLTIEDDGPGIPPEQLPVVLQRGVRADQRTAGHGIGLAVVYELVRLTGGEMQADTGRHGGLRWVVKLPSPI